MQKLGPTQALTIPGDTLGNDARPPANDDDKPRLEETLVPEVFRLHSGTDLGLDIRTIKGEAAADGLVSFEDAQARGISRAEWKRTVACGAASDLLNRIVELFKKADRAHRAPPGHKPADPSRTIAVRLQDGRTHMLSPALKAACDTQVQAMFAELAAARAQGKRTLYVSTFISSVDVATNKAIARFVEKKITDDPQWGGKIFVVNPGTRQGVLPKGALGDDFMYMWEQLLTLNVFHAVRFTSADDTKQYFAAQNQPMPLDYIFTYGDALHSAGCRYEWNIFARINRALARQNKSHHMVAIYHGDKPVEPPLLTTLLDTIDYRTRGEIVE